MLKSRTLQTKKAYSEKYRVHWNDDITATPNGKPIYMRATL